MTHDPNMLKKVTGELSWEIKSVSSRTEIAKFPAEIVHTSTSREVQEVLQSPKYSTMRCESESRSPFSISTTKNNNPFTSCHFTLSCRCTFYTNLVLVELMLISSHIFVRATNPKNTYIIAIFWSHHYTFTLTHQWQVNAHVKSFLSRINGKWARTINLLSHAPMEREYAR